MRSRRWLLLALAVAAIVLLGGRALATVYVEYRWYEAMGATSLWRAQTLTTVVVGTLSAIAGTLLVFANLYAVRYSVISLVLPRRVGNLEIGEEVPGRYLMWAVIALSLVFGLLLTLPHESWTTAFAAMVGQPFRESDPYIPADIGFFVYWLPFENSLYVWTLVAVLLVTALVVFLYALTPSLRWERGTVHVSNYVRRHLTILGALLMLLLAWSYRIDAYELIAKGRGIDAAFTSIDHRVAIPGSLFLSWLTAVAALLVVIFGWRGQTRAAFFTVTGIIVVSVVIRHIGPAIASQLAEPSDPVRREQPYETTRRLYTVQAFATDEVIVLDSAPGFADVRSAVRHVPIWDPAALLRAIDRTGQPPSGQLGWQPSPGGLLALVPRGATTGSDSETSMAPWDIVRVLAFTADERGAYVPARDAGWVRDELPVPPALVSVAATGYLVISDSLDVIPAPELDTGISRLAHAWSHQNFRLLLGDLPGPHPTIVRRRDVRERVRALAPFFTQGTLVTPILHADSLLWAVDLYSTSTYYPLSHHLPAGGRERGYFRHAATALVHAGTGRVTIVAEGMLDPIAATWRTQFPRLFTSASELPPALRAALPPPIDGARIQGHAYVRYGSRQRAAPSLQLPWESGADSILMGGAEPLLQLGPDGVTTWTSPVLDEDDRVVGILLATGGPSRRVLWLPLGDRGPSWGAALTRLREPVDTALGERDPPVVRGRVRVVPVGDGAVLVQPSYTWRVGVAPTVRAVTVLAADGVRTGRTFADAVGVTLEPTPAPPPLPIDFRLRVNALYEAMRTAVRRGDWAAFGAAFDSLGAILASPRS